MEPGHGDPLFAIGLAAAAGLFGLRTVVGGVRHRVLLGGHQADLDVVLVLLILRLIDLVGRDFPAHLLLHGVLLVGHVVVDVVVVDVVVANVSGRLRILPELAQNPNITRIFEFSDVFQLPIVLQLKRFTAVQFGLVENSQIGAGGGNGVYQPEEGSLRSSRGEAAQKWKTETGPSLSNTETEYEMLTIFLAVGCPSEALIEPPLKFAL